MKVSGGVLQTALNGDFKTAGQTYYAQVCDGLTCYAPEVVTFSNATSDSSSATIVTSGSVSWAMDIGEKVNRLLLYSLDSGEVDLRYYIDDTLTEEIFDNEGTYTLLSITVVVG